jgi:predicted nucleic acid-binding protein
MKRMEAYIGNGELRWVSLDKDIELLTPETQVMNFTSLQKKLESEMKSDKSVVAIVEGKNIRLKLHNTMKFSGIIWSNQKRLSGNYSYI